MQFKCQLGLKKLHSCFCYIPAEIAGISYSLNSTPFHFFTCSLFVLYLIVQVLKIKKKMVEGTKKRTVCLHVSDRTQDTNVLSCLRRDGSGSSQDLKFTY